MVVKNSNLKDPKTIGFDDFISSDCPKLLLCRKL